jgi:hypothetical protein
MSVNVKSFLCWCLLFWIPDAGAQSRLPCDSILHRAHRKLGSLYAGVVGNEGYTFNVTIIATYRDKTIGKIKPQQFYMTVAGGMLLFESENLDSFQDDSVRISVIKTQNRIYIADSDGPASENFYMDHFNAVQKVLPRLVSIQNCKQVDGKVHLQTTIKTDTLGLDQVKSIAYVIDKKTNTMIQIALDFADNNPIINYRISYSEVVKPYVMPAAVIDKYAAIAQRSASGIKQFERYSIIDNRKKLIHD